MDRLYSAIRGKIGRAALADSTPISAQAIENNAYQQRFVDAMDDDFNTREAITLMQELAGAINQRERAGDDWSEPVRILVGLGAILGILLSDPEDYFKGLPTTAGPGDPRASDPGAPNSGPSYTNDAVDQLIAERNQARANRDFARADAIRDQLKEVGIVLEDSGKETRWRRE